VFYFFSPNKLPIVKVLSFRLEGLQEQTFSEFGRLVGPEREREREREREQDVQGGQTEMKKKEKKKRY